MGSGSRGRQNTGSSDTRGLLIDVPEFSPGSFSNESTSIEASGISGTTNLATCVSNVDLGVTILLCTALIRVKDFWGNYQTCRCLLDNGSQASLINSQCLESGADSTEEAVRLITELQEMMQMGGFCLRKWSSDPSIFKDLPRDSQETDLVHLDDSDCSVLGAKWFSFWQVLLRWRGVGRGASLDQPGFNYVGVDPWSYVGPVMEPQNGRLVFRRGMWSQQEDAVPAFSQQPSPPGSEIPSTIPGAPKDPPARPWIPGATRGHKYIYLSEII
ncbi:hypothetical protein JTE90_001894 [Oedothorax gibbosus]|uniref:Uncharacterized protein n=1 Tax=Oedothorax gibbosus TaxID=931172 RepID=A0AAV6VQP6_9ARAC|nr:hypothetical protein JTE90_001894 [Oedothorax gibbosus]